MGLMSRPIPLPRFFPLSFLNYSYPRGCLAGLEPALSKLGQGPLYRLELQSGPDLIIIQRRKGFFTCLLGLAAKFRLRDPIT